MQKYTSTVLWYLSDPFCLDTFLVFFVATYTSSFLNVIIPAASHIPFKIMSQPKVLPKNSQLLTKFWAKLHMCIKQVPWPVAFVGLFGPGTWERNCWNIPPPWDLKLPSCMLLFPNMKQTNQTNTHHFQQKSIRLQVEVRECLLCFVEWWAVTLRLYLPTGEVMGKLCRLHSFATETLWNLHTEH